LETTLSVLVDYWGELCQATALTLTAVVGLVLDCVTRHNLGSLSAMQLPTAVGSDNLCTSSTANYNFSKFPTGGARSPPPNNIKESDTVSHQGCVTLHPWPCDFHLWDHLKSLMYANKSRNIKELKEEIRRILGEIEVETCRAVIVNFMDRVVAWQRSRAK